MCFPTVSGPNSNSQMTIYGIIIVVVVVIFFVVASSSSSSPSSLSSSCVRDILCIVAYVIYYFQQMCCQAVEEWLSIAGWSSFPQLCSQHRCPDLQQDLELTNTTSHLTSIDITPYLVPFSRY